MKSKSNRSLVLFAILLFPGGYALADSPVILRSSVTPEAAWVGQQVILHIDVLAKDGWSQIKKVGDAEVEGAQLLRLESQGTRLSETIDGDAYTGQRYEFMLYAQRAGKIIVPPLELDVEVKTWGTAAASRMQRMSTRRIELAARTPPGAAGIPGLISSSDFTATQKWEPQIENLQVGDAITRTITLRAKDVSGMAFTPMLHSDIEHLGIYPGEPDVQDKFARGDLTGTRIETVTYVFEQSGEFEIPPVVLHWWDVRNNELRLIELPALSLQITGEAAAALAPVEVLARQQNVMRQWPAVLAVLLVAVVALRYSGRMMQYASAQWQARSEREAACFRRAMRSLKSTDRNVALRDTMRWLDRINQGSRPAQLGQFLHLWGDPRSQAASLILLNTQTDDSDIVDVTALVSGLKAARVRWQRAQRDHGHDSGILPYLNGGK